MIVAIVEEVVVIEKSTTLDLRRRLRDLVKRVALSHDEFMIERKAKSLAAMVPVQKLQQLERLARCDFLIPLPRRRRRFPRKKRTPWPTKPSIAQEKGR